MVDQTSTENVIHIKHDTNVTVQNDTRYHSGIANAEYNAQEDVTELKEPKRPKTNDSSNEIMKESNNVWNVFRTYKWSKSIQEMVLGSFYLGYCLMTFPMGLVAQRWGGKVPLQIGLFVNGFMSILIPWFAILGDWKAVCASRILQGMSQAGLYSGTITLMANWAPQRERGRLPTYVMAGSVLGTVLAFQLGGILADTWGWPSVFWGVGVLCMLAGLLLTVFGAATPSLHKNISEAERRFILGHSRIEPVKKQQVPWLAIFKSKRVWALFVAHAGNGVPFIFLLTQVPSYLHYILGLNIKKSGLLSSLPYIGNFFTAIVVGTLSDFCTNRNILSVKNSRRIFNTLGVVGLAASIVIVSLTDSMTLAVASLVFGMSLNAAADTGFVVNYIDVAPNYSGTLISIGTTFLNLCVIGQPVIISNILTDIYNLHQWRTVLFIAAGWGFFSNLVFVMFMSSDVRPWNDIKPAKTDIHEEELKTLKDN